MSPPYLWGRTLTLLKVNCTVTLCLRKCIWCNTQVSLFPVCCPGEAGAARLGCICEMCPNRPPSPSAPALAMSREMARGQWGAEPHGQPRLAEAVAAGVLAQRPPLGNVPSPTPLVHQAAGRPLCGHPRSPASMGQARIPTRPPRNLCTPHTASAPCRRLTHSVSAQAAGDRGQVLWASASVL